jgi:hypothetical protein
MSSSLSTSRTWVKCVMGLAESLIKLVVCKNEYKCVNNVYCDTASLWSVAFGKKCHQTANCSALLRTSDCGLQSLCWGRLSRGYASFRFCTKGKLTLWTPWRHNVSVRAWLHWYITSSLDGEESATSRPGRFTPCEKALCIPWMGWAPQLLWTVWRRAKSLASGPTNGT